MSFFSDGLSFGANRLQDAGSERVTYRRGSQSATVRATRGKTMFEELRSEGDAEVQAKAFDFLILACELRLGDQDIQPARLDQIETEDGQVFEVLQSLDGLHWRWSDEHQNTLRIHTVRRESGQ